MCPLLNTADALVAFADAYEAGDVPAAASFAAVVVRLGADADAVAICACFLFGVVLSFPRR